MIVVGGVIPPDDVPTLQEMGAAAVFPPGTVIAEAALDLLEKLCEQLGPLMAGPCRTSTRSSRASARAAAPRSSRAITLVESLAPDHRAPARELLAALADGDRHRGAPRPSGSASPACPGSASRRSSRRSARR